MSFALQSRVGSCSVKAARCSVVVRAEQPSRRAALGILFGAVSAGALLLAPERATAIALPSQESTNTHVSRQSSSTASMESYDMEGTKKNGIKASKKVKILAKIRAAAEKASKK